MDSTLSRSPASRADRLHRTDGATERSRFARVMDAIFDAVLGVVLLVELAVLFTNVVLRALTGYSFAWGNEVAVIALTTMAFIGGTVAYDHGSTWPCIC